MVIVEDTEHPSLSTECNDCSPEKPTSGKYAHVEHLVGVRKGVMSYLTRKPVPTMLVEAIYVLGRDGNGASAPAITKWICGNYAVPNMETLKVQLKKAIMKALKSGIIERSKSSKKSLGTGGSFILGEKSTKKKSAGRRKSKNISELEENGS